MSASDFSAGHFLQAKASLVHPSSQLGCKRRPVSVVENGIELRGTGENISWSPKIPGYSKRSGHSQRFVETIYRYRQATDTMF
jgi:hypothetical protein